LAGLQWVLPDLGEESKLGRGSQWGGMDCTLRGLKPRGTGRCVRKDLEKGGVLLPIYHCRVSSLETRWPWVPPNPVLF